MKLLFILGIPILNLFIGFSFLRPELFLSFRCNRHLEPFMCKVKSQALRGHKAKNWPVNFSGNRNL